MRFGQLVDNLYTKFYSSVHGVILKDFFYIEDDEFYEWLLKFEGFDDSNFYYHN